MDSKMNLSYLLLIIGLQLVSSGHLPPELKVCSKSDPNFIECVQKGIEHGLEFFKDGYKPLAVPILNPFPVDKLELGGDPSASVSLNQKYKDIKIYGMAHDSRITNLKIDFEKCHWTFDASSDEIKMESDYEMQGKMLVFPINGKGKSVVLLKDLTVHYTVDCERYKKKNGKTHIKLTKVTMIMDPKSVHFDFENLVPGNAELSDTIGKTMNENGLTIFKEIKGGFEGVFGTIFQGVANAVFSRIPEEEIFLD